MICSKCKTDFARPLVLFRGSLACPVCRNKLVAANTKLSITKQNEALFKLSETAFYRGIKENNRAFLDYAIDLCRKACNLGNARAFLKMGFYYDKNLTGEPLAKKYRVLLAFEYESAVCYSKISCDNLEQEINIGELKRQAAEQMLKMLLKFPEGKTINRRYSVEYQSDLLQKKGVTGIELPTLDPGQKETVANTFSEMVSGLLHRETNALLCVYRFRGEALCELLANGSCEKVLHETARSGNVLFKYYLNNIGAQPGRSVSNDDQFEQFRKMISESPAVEFILMFFNNKCRLHFFRAGQLRNIRKYLYDDIGAIDHIMDADRLGESFAFYEDDIFFCTEKGKIDQSVKSNFSDYMIKGDEN